MGEVVGGGIEDAIKDLMTGSLDSDGVPVDPEGTFPGA